MTASIGINSKSASAPDRVLRAGNAGCSLWWHDTPLLAGQPVGFIGEFFATAESEAKVLLQAACDELRKEGMALAVGPVDGNTFNSYRFVSWSSGAPPFFLEPQNPEEYPEFFQKAEFDTLATYYSSITDGLDDDEKTVLAIEAKMNALGVRLRALDATRFTEELHNIFRVCAVSFADNFLYSPISEQQFVGQYQALRTVCDPRLIQIAEDDGGIVGFVLALPDVSHGGNDVIIVKTLARVPRRELAGLGHLLLAKVQREARTLGYKRAIHALMHQSNASVGLSNRYAHTFREYAIYAKVLV